MTVNRSLRSRQQHAERAKARKLVHNRVGTNVFLAAQGFKCPLCGYDLDNDISIDHVWSLATVKQHAGNLLLAHHACNRKKHDNPPDEVSLEMLETVNACLGFDGERYKCDMIKTGPFVYTDGDPKELPPAEFVWNQVKLLHAYWMTR